MGSSCSSNPSSKEAEEPAAKNDRTPTQLSRPPSTVAVTRVITPVSPTRSTQRFTNKLEISEKVTADREPSVTDLHLPSEEREPSTKTGDSAVSLISASKLKTQQETTKSSLPDLSKLSKVVQNLVLGNVICVRPILKPRKICIYTCADLQDTIMERSALMEYVYPKMRMYCVERGYELHLIDLHWGLQNEHVNDHSLKELCLAELTSHSKDSHVVTIVFLNETFGNALLPRLIEGPDFDQAVSKIENDADRELLWKWYQWDENASPPCYKLIPLSNHIPEINEQSASVRTEAFKQWRTYVKRMMEVMGKIFSQEQKEKYLSTVMEQEIKQSIFTNQQSSKRCLWLCRKFIQFPSHNIPDYAKAYIASEPESKKRLDILQSELKERLDEIRTLKFKVKWHNSGMNPEVTEHAQFVEDLCAQFSPLLISIIDSILEEDENKIKEELKSYIGIDKRLFHELMQQSLVCQSRIKTFVGRQEILTKIRRYLSNDSCVPLILHGKAGCGKSALIAKVMERCCEWLSDTAIVVRFVGLTPASSTTEQVLRSIAEQCCFIYGEHVAAACKGIRNMTTFLPKLLSNACPALPLVIIIDGMDQVRPYGHCNLDWVPKELPECVKLILTVAEGSKEHAEMEKKIVDKACFLKIPNLTTEEAVQIFDKILKQEHRSIKKNQRDIVNIFIQDNPLPLYVETVARLACKWAGDEEHLPVKSTLVEQIHQVFDKLEESFGKIEVSRTLGYFTTAKQGLSDSEIMDILSCDEVVLERIFKNEAPPVRRCPSLLWSQISSSLAPFLQKTIVSGICLTTWRDQTYRAVAKDRYLSDPEQSAEICSNIIDYFQGRWANGKKKPLPVTEMGVEESKDRFVLDQPTKYRTRYNRRKLDELPYLIYQMKGKFLEEYVLNTEWIFDKLCGSDAYQMQEDVYLALNDDSSNGELPFLQELLELAAYALGYDGHQFHTQLYCRMFGQMNQADSEAKFPTLKKMFDEAAKAPVPMLLPLKPCLQEPFQPIPDPAKADRTVYFNAVYRTKQNPHHVITVSTDRGEISVWNIFTMTPVRTLMGINKPYNLKMIDEYRCLVLCSRELNIYNFDEGLFIMKLKGMMNQKMPFYGLHDKDHVVALSRDRMYVNMMNLENGDCVATFKVGEDRFLNSLLVSEDGSICVCGDETQKPFPLLVWDLRSRKLMYDLRIPQHEFVTRLAAITMEGHYVCCVCKEVDDPSPNFIIVYDLQSGTMFKKWKPGVDVISIAISSQGGCVVSGLEDSRISVWDLMTGNCRWTMKGHTSPPDTIRLDQRGHRCLSYDSSGCDRSIRVWELTTGQCKGVFTPDESITACDISSDGKAVILALQGLPSIVTFLICQESSIEIPNIRIYGNDANKEKVFDLSQAGAWSINKGNGIWS